MRMIVLSDSHNDKASLKQIIADRCNDTNLFVFLGDGIEEFEDITVFDSKIKAVTVKGNCDYDSNADDYEFFEFAGKKVFATHGHLYDVKDGLARLKQTAIAKGADICLYGHTHIQHYEKDGDLVVLNPGAVNGSGKYGVVNINNGDIEVELM